MGLRMVKRAEPWALAPAVVAPLAVAASLALSGLLLAAQGKDPFAALWFIYQGALGDGYGLVESLRKAAPLFLCSLGVAVAFRLRVWNIGAEGQYALGAIGATAAVLAFPGAPAWVLLPCLMAAGALFGAAWAWLAAALRTRLAVNEIISTLMLNYIAALLLDYLVYGPWRDPTSFGFPMSAQFPDAALLGGLFGTRLHAGLALAVVCAGLVWFLMARTRFGFELTAAGLSPRAATYARMDVNRLVVLAMCASGALAGLAGAVETSAVVGRLQPGVLAGYGYTAIIVAWLSRLNPWSMGAASLLLAALRVGVENLELEMGVPSAFGHIIEGQLLLFVLAGQFLTDYKLAGR